MEMKKGMLARSKAGHDKGKLYVILNIEETYAFLVDGDLRTMDHPKKKKKKHLQIIGCIPAALEEKSAAGKAWRDEEVKRALKLSEKE